jgi:hypothetical protein
MLGPGIWRYVCSRAKNHPGSKPYVWEATDREVIRVDEVGAVATELGLAKDLLACMSAGEPWVEYGVIEHRYRLAKPDTFHTLVERYGASALELPGDRPVPARPVRLQNGYSASVYVAHTLSRLSRKGKLSLQFQAPTGPWQLANSISYWALPPAPPLDSLLTYEAFAEQPSLHHTS